jgi:hypothetical protein
MFNLQAPAFAGAPALRKASGGGASRRQANNQTITDIEYPISKYGDLVLRTFCLVIRSLKVGIYLEFACR